jgi:tetratricopeptide (TPR) repeat protein
MADEVPALTPVPATPQRAAAEALLQRGVSCYDRQELAPALEAFQHCVQTDPECIAGYTRLSTVYLDLERYDEAIAAAFEALRRDDLLTEAYSNLGFALRRLGRNLEAAAAYSRLLELEPTMEQAPRIRTWLQALLKEKGLDAVPPLAIPRAAPAAAIPPSTVVPIQSIKPIIVKPPRPDAQNVGTAPKIKKAAAWEIPAETDMALAALREIEASPTPADRTSLHQTQSDLPPVTPETPAPPPTRPRPAALPGSPSGLQATRPRPVALTGTPPPGSHAREAVKTPTGHGSAATPAQEDPITLIEQGMTEFATGHLDEAAGLFQRVLVANPNDAEARVGLGRVLVQQSKFTAGIAELEQAVKLNAADPAAYYVLGFALRSVERNVDAAEAYEAFLKLMPDALDAAKTRQWIGHIKGLAADTFDAEQLEILEEAEDVEIPDEEFKAALTTFRGGNLVLAATKCQEILSADTGHVRARYLLGRCRFAQQEFSSGIHEFEAALIGRPKHAEALYYLGRSFEQNQDLAAAAEAYRRYLRLVPNGPRTPLLKTWFLSRGVPQTETVPKQQAQCEWCLRFFPASEIKQHDGKATCAGCLAIMGPGLVTEMLERGGPVPPSAQAAVPAASVRVPTPARAPAPPWRLYALAGVLAVVAIGYFAYPWMQKKGWLGKRPPLSTGAPPVARPPGEDARGIPPAPPPTPVGTFEAKNVVLRNEPPALAAPFARWAYTPVLEGVDALTRQAPGWKVECVVKNPPPGMAATAEGLSWLPEPKEKDYDELKRGKTYTVDVEVKGFVQPPGGTRQDLFSVSKRFTVTMRFGYELGPDLSLGLKPGDHVSLAATAVAVEGDTLFLLGAGQLRGGIWEECLLRPDGNVRTAGAENKALANGARFSTACAALPDGSNLAVGANWQNGVLNVLGSGPAGRTVNGRPASIGPGVVALCAADVNGDGTVEIAALSSMAGRLSLAALKPDLSLGPVTIVAVPSAGGEGFVLPWTSAQVGPGFLAITPLAETPFQFVPCGKDALAQAGAAPVTIASGQEDGIITGAAIVKAPPARPRLAVMFGGEVSRVLLFDEQDGKFTPLDARLPPVSGIGVGLVACDLNRDGLDDLVVVAQDEVSLLFSKGAEGFAQGPRFATPRLLGPAIALNAKADQPPAILVITQDRKARLLRAP